MDKNPINLQVEEKIGPTLTETQRNVCYGCQYFNRVLAKSSRQQPLYDNYCQHPKAIEEDTSRRPSEQGRFFSRNDRGMTPRWCPVVVGETLEGYAEELKKFGEVATGEKSDE